MLGTAQRTKTIKASATLAVAGKAAEMKAKGIDLVNFGPGEPDFNTPDHIADAGIAAIKSGFTRYTTSSGILELREAICDKLEKENNAKYAPGEIVVSTGAKQALYNALQAICDPGDEIIMPYPCWVSYIYIVELAGGVPVYLYTDEKDEFRIDLDQLEKLITPKTKGIMINTPNNPTGCVYSYEDLKGIAELALKYKFYIIADEVYEKLIYDQQKHHSVASFSEEIKDLTITINGVSKAYAMTGWRIGFSASSKAIAKVIGDIQSHSTSNPNSIAQKAALAAYRGGLDTVVEMVKAFEERRNVMVEKINELPLMSCVKPQGAFYVMGNISQVLGKKYGNQVIANSQDFAQLLLEESKVALTSGGAFGPEWASDKLDNFVRMSYATSMERILEGIRRMNSFLSQLR